MQKIKTSVKVKKAEDWNTHLVDYRVLVIGLESSGKSSIIHLITCNEFAQNITPTKGVCVTPYSTNGQRIIFHEIGGCTESRGLMKFYYSCDAVIFVIDSTQKTQLTKAPDIDEHTYSDNDDDQKSESALSPTTSPSNTNNNDACNNKAYEYTDKQTGNLSPIPSFMPESNPPIPKLSSNDSLQTPTFSFLEDPLSPSSVSSPLYKFDDEKAMFSVRPELRQAHSAFEQYKNGKIKIMQRRSIGPSNPLDQDHKNYINSHQIVTRKRGDTLKPLTMNEAKCNSAQELLSKLNYDLRDYGIPFLIYLNKQDCAKAMNENEIIKKLEFKQIIHKMREYATYGCNAKKDEYGVIKGFKWLMKRLNDRKIREKQSAKINAKRMSQSGSVYEIDLNKYGPSVKNPKCVVCDIECSLRGSYCTVCGKWYCHRDKLTKMIERKSGSKCKFCVGQKSRFIPQTHKRKRSKTTPMM